MNRSISMIPQETNSEICVETHDTKVIMWGSLRRGSCRQETARLILRSEGTGTFSCITHTDDCKAGDMWHADFAVKDLNGETLFGIGPFYSPRMHTGHPPPKYTWAAQFNFRPQYFSDAASATQRCGSLLGITFRGDIVKPTALAQTDRLLSRFIANRGIVRVPAMSYGSMA